MDAVGAAGLVAELVTCADEDAQDGGVHEGGVGEVDDESAGIGGDGLGQAVPELVGEGQVEVAGGGEDGGVADPFHVEVHIAPDRRT